ncbi:DUF1553 domain-containing protein [Flexithrix dorotheae]|uniref:DUF1553 domain-containing protein n=1 Tax=Flexithrix dorotheae TaxID=70993 RepID=UPI0003609127|nr:DUF1553 domain-containing protein [Flexithrix dorotheae]
MKKRNFLILIILLAVISFFTYETYFTSKISYNASIRPIFNKHCLKCHGGVKKNGGFSLISQADAFGETESGIPAIVPGNHQKSELYQRLIHHDPEIRMPQESAPLTEQEIELIAEWIDEGAEWEKHWAYYPPDPDIQVPVNSQPDWAKNEIDFFVREKLEDLKLKPSEEAEKEILIRRLYLDLIGMPPSPEEAQSFLKNPTEEAYEKEIDSLLASSHLGEKWASMWLDLARYADTKGYEKDSRRTIWKYRDWVIRAFNDNMPFDQFTVEQLAGDLLEKPNESQFIATAFHRNSLSNDEGGTDNEEFRVSAVVERVGTTFEVWQGTTMSCVQCHSHPYDPITQKEFYQFMAYFNNSADKDIYNEKPNIWTYENENKQKADELISWISRNLEEEKTFKGRFLYEKRNELLDYLGMNKIEGEAFDETSVFIELMPPNQDIIWQIQDSSWVMYEDIDLTDVEAITFHVATQLAGFIDVYVDDLRGQPIGTIEVKKTGEWNRWDVSRPEDPSYWHDLKLQINEQAGKHDLYFYFRADKVLAGHLFHVDWFQLHDKAPRIDQYSAQFKEMVDSLAKLEAVPTPILKELPSERSRKTFLFERGNWLSPGYEVKPQIPAILVAGDTNRNFTNRLEMANWLVSRENPLTARVFVNRIWEQIFGYGIVATMEEFGSQGEKPTHPALLDWLALKFMEDFNWELKPLIKEIVMSATYRQSSRNDSLKNEIDPYNQYFSRGPRIRLSAEQLRDQSLKISGLLNDELYGPPIMPPRPDAGPSLFSQWYSDKDEQKFRRAVYIHGKRTNPFPAMVTFDGPARNICSSRRIRTNTPLQALVLMNDSIYFEMSFAFAQKMHELNMDVKETLKSGYEMALIYPPDSARMAILEEYYHKTAKYYQENPGTMRGVLMGYQSEKKNESFADSLKLASLAMVGNIIMNLDEFVTKQ